LRAADRGRGLGRLRGQACFLGLEALLGFGHGAVAFLDHGLALEVRGLDFDRPLVRQRAAARVLGFVETIVSEELIVADALALGIAGFDRGPFARHGGQLLVGLGDRGHRRRRRLARDRLGAGAGRQGQAQGQGLGGQDGAAQYRFGFHRFLLLGLGDQFTPERRRHRGARPACIHATASQ
jgi:hypothetical protein